MSDFDGYIRVSLVGDKYCVVGSGAARGKYLHEDLAWRSVVSLRTGCQGWFSPKSAAEKALVDAKTKPIKIANQTEDIIVTLGMCGYYVSKGCGKDTRYLHKDGTWNPEAISKDDREAGWFKTKEEAESCLDKTLVDEPVVVIMGKS